MLAISCIANWGIAGAAEEKVPVAFLGGHDIGKNDFGRPVALIAAGLLSVLLFPLIGLTLLKRAGAPMRADAAPAGLVAM